MVFVRIVYFYQTSTKFYFICLMLLLRFSKSSVNLQSNRSALIVKLIFIWCYVDVLVGLTEASSSQKQGVANATSQHRNTDSVDWNSLFSESDDEDDTGRSTVSQIKKEMALYTSLPLLKDKSSDPLDWWRRNQGSFPKLAALARKYLCVQANSCASERAFSKAGNIVTDKRICLKPEKVNMFVFMSCNASGLV